MCCSKILFHDGLSLQGVVLPGPDLGDSHSAAAPSHLRPGDQALLQIGRAWMHSLAPGKTSAVQPLWPSFTLCLESSWVTSTQRSQHLTVFGVLWGTFWHGSSWFSPSVCP